MENKKENYETTMRVKALTRNKLHLLAVEKRISMNDMIEELIKNYNYIDDNNPEKPKIKTAKLVDEAKEMFTGEEA